MATNDIFFIHVLNNIKKHYFFKIWRKPIVYINPSFFTWLYLSHYYFFLFFRLSFSSCAYSALSCSATSALYRLGTFEDTSIFPVLVFFPASSPLFSLASTFSM